MIAIAVGEFGRIKRDRHAVAIADDAGDTDQVVLTVVVHIGNPKLVAFGIIYAVRGLVNPALCKLTVAIIPCDGEALKISAADAFSPQNKMLGCTPSR